MSRPEVGVSSSIRASGGMLIGYGASQLINFLVQVGIVRTLTKAEYGAYAWALSVVLLAQAVLPLGLERANARFLAKYDEESDYSHLFGFIVLEFIVVLGLGSVVVGTVWLLQGSLTSLAPSQYAVTILVILIALAPIQALDVIVVDMFAVFASPWSVFLRRYVMEPLLRLAVVALMVLGQHDAKFLTIGLVLVGATGLTLYLILLRGMFRKAGLAGHFSWRRLELPWRPVASFCGPLILTSLVSIGTTEFAAVMLGHYRQASETAMFRAVQPFAVLNLGVLFAFTTLFTPSLARMVARGSNEEAKELYWQSAVWVTVFTFPIVGLMTANAEQFTVLTLGERYESSAPILMILSVAYYINAAFGFNGMTIQMLGRSKWIVITNLVTLAVMITATLTLIPEWGAYGAAITVLITLVTHNFLKQLGLGFKGGFGVLNRRHTVVLIEIAFALAVLHLVFERVGDEPPLWMGVIVVGLSWLVLVRLSRRALRVPDVFPEVSSVPFVRWLVSVDDHTSAAGPPDRDPDGPAPLRMWRSIDWRFLIPAGVNSVSFDGPVSGDEVRVLREAGVEMVPTGQSRVDALVVINPDRSALQSYFDAVHPGGWVLLRLGENRAAIKARIHRDRLSTWMAAVRERDGRAVSAYWHAPNAQRASYIVDLSDRVAVSAMLQRYQGVRFGYAKSLVTRLLNRVGLIAVVARDVTLLGQRQWEHNERGVQPDAMVISHLLSDRSAHQHDALSTLLITPWFDASRHVVNLYYDRSAKALTAVSKMPRRPGDTDGIELEFRALRTVIDASPDIASSIPGPVHLELASARPYLLETPLLGSAVDPAYVRANSGNVIRAGSQFVAGLIREDDFQIHNFEEIVGQPLRRLAADVFPGDADVQTMTEQTLALVEPLRLAHLPWPLVHGDMSHPNLVMQRGSKLGVLDWERFSQHGLPLQDLVFFLQYISECLSAAVARREQLRAFDSAFVGPDAWARPWLEAYADRLQIARSSIPALILAAWAVTSTGLIDRIDPAGDGDQPALGSAVTPLEVAETFRSDRDHDLWVHALARFPQL